MFKFLFPLGYHDLVQDENVNFQLNRWVSGGYARLQDFKAVAPKIQNYQDWKREMLDLAKQAIAENRPVNAAFYYRAAEFFTSPDDPDKMALYEKFIELFYNTFQDQQIERVSVPYRDSFLSALHLPAAKSKGVIVIHGGSDSFIEEFYSMATYIVTAGYTVIMFEGPGQGATLKKHSLTLTYEWEKPVGAVLDFFGLDNVTLVGVSLGGYLCLRAAAFEPRITRVVAFDIFYDYLNRGDLFAYVFVSLLLNLKIVSYFNSASRKKMQADLRVDWAIRQGMQITGTDTPYDYFKHIQQYSIANQHADQVRQDVLLLAGAKDHFIPLKTYTWQKQALKNARSVTGRIFTEQEQAQNHCQVGNIKLALDVILEWIDQKS